MRECPYCGGRMERIAERALQCTTCGAMQYPAIIRHLTPYEGDEDWVVWVQHDDHLVLQSVVEIEDGYQIKGWLLGDEARARRKFLARGSWYAEPYFPTEDGEQKLGPLARD